MDKDTGLTDGVLMDVWGGGWAGVDLSLNLIKK